MSVPIVACGQQCSFKPLTNMYRKYHMQTSNASWQLATVPCKRALRCAVRPIPFHSGALWHTGPTFSQGEGAVPVVGSCWLQSGLLQVPPQLRVVGVEGRKVEGGAAAKHDRLSGTMQVEHRANCGAAGEVGGNGVCQEEKGSTVGGCNCGGV